jgi:hypothetical protein
VQLPERLADGGTHRISAHAGGVALTTPPTFIRGAPRRAPAGSAEPSGDDPWAGTVFVPDGEAGPPGAASDAPAETTETTEAERAGRRRGRRRRGAQPGVELAGYVDGVTGDELFGWVVDPARPDESLRVEAFFDRESLGTAAADLVRGDLARAGYGERHGFRFALGGELGPGIHLVEVRIEDSELHVPLASDYIVIDAAGAPIGGVSLRPAGAAAPPPPLEPPKAALLGLDGWLFDWLGDDEFELLRGARPPAPATLEHQQNLLRERHELARTAGATAVEAIVPAKFAVYRESLPAGIELIESGRPADRLAAALREHNEVDVLDLSVALRQARSHGEVFPRTARGLTWLGGFAAYRVIAKRLARAGVELTPLLRSELTFGELEPVGEHLADLPRMVWIGSHAVAAGTAAEDEPQEGHPRLDWSGLSTEYAVLPGELAAVAGPSAAMLRRREPGGLPDALVIHDGSAGRIAPFLAEHFERTLVIGAGADIEAVLAALEPAAMVTAVAESTLLRTPESA